MKKVAEFASAKFGFAVSSGSSAIILALKCLGVGPGDGVILPTYVCRSVLEAVYTVGGVPELCDVNEFGVMDVNTISRAISKKTKTIIAVHIFANPCNIDELRVFGLPIIEDACQALGLKTPNGNAGSRGDIGILSFHATKCITTGEGGMLLTNDPGIAGVVKKLILGVEIPQAVFSHNSMICKLHWA